MASKRDDAELSSYADDVIQGQDELNPDDNSGDLVEVVDDNDDIDKTQPTAVSSLSGGRRKDDDGFYKSIDATQLYLNEIGFSPLLTPEEEVHYARLARKGVEAGRRRMIESNLRLVDEQKFESHKRVTIYGRVLDYYSHLLIFIAPIPSNIMFAAFWLFSYSRIECHCLHGIIHLLLGISFQS